MKKLYSLILALCLILSLTACGDTEEASNEIVVFAAASLQESLDEAINL